MTPNRLKILLVIPTLDRCGAEKQLTLLAANLPKERFDVRVVALTRGGPYEATLREAGVPVDVIGKTAKFSPRAYWRLKKIIRDFRPDVVHTWLFAANAYGRRAAFSLGVPAVVCGERCLDPWKARWQGWVDRRLEPKTDAFAVNSSGIVDFYVERGIPAEKFVVIPNAVETPAPRPADADAKVALLKELKLPYEPGRLPLLIGLVARLWPQKRVKEALWAADQLKFAQLDFYLLVIGDGPERESLLRYRDALRATDRVRFLGERDDVSRLMPHFDVLWNCSAYEGQSNAILEAQSLGVPVVASDVPGNRDLVIPGETGVLVPEFDGDHIRRRTALTRETFRLLKDENAATRRALADAARARVEREFSLDALIARHVELYERLVVEKKRR